MALGNEKLTPIQTRVSISHSAYSQPTANHHKQIQQIKLLLCTATSKFKNVTKTPYFKLL